MSCFSDSVDSGLYQYIQNQEERLASMQREQARTKGELAKMVKELQNGDFEDLIKNIIRVFLSRSYMIKLYLMIIQSLVI